MGRHARRIFGGASKCAAESIAYGQCVVSNLENLQKNQCLNEFQAFKNCVQTHVNRYKRSFSNSRLGRDGNN